MNEIQLMYNWAAEEEWQKMQQKNTFKDKTEESFSKRTL